MTYYMSVQSVRFRSSADYEQFRMLFAGVGKHPREMQDFI